jgi:hypothetical protein
MRKDQTRGLKKKKKKKKKMKSVKSIGAVAMIKFPNSTDNRVTISETETFLYMRASGLPRLAGRNEDPLLSYQNFSERSWGFRLHLF